MKGKHGAAAAERRIAELERRLQVATESAQSAAAAAKEREVQLKSELQQVQGKLSKAVREAAAEQVLAVRQQAREQVAAAHEKRDEQMRGVIRYLLNELGGSLASDDWTRLADLAGMKWGEFLQLDESVRTNNKQRRMSTRMARLNVQIKQDSQSFGL